jgi:hypothetical protein
VGPRAGLDAVEKRKTSRPCRESNPGSPARNPSLYLLSYPGSHVNKYSIEKNCYHDMVHTQIANRKRWSPDREGICRNVALASAGGRTGVVLQLGNCAWN